MRQLLRRMVPDAFEDLVAVLALYRPGPLESGMVDQYVECKHQRREVEYPHPQLRDVLRETYGVILYQEQVMQIAAVLAGFSLGEADLLRRAMGKKKEEVMREQRGKFVAGCLRNAVDEKWMKLTRSARHYMERRAKARKETIDGSEARH